MSTARAATAASIPLFRPAIAAEAIEAAAAVLSSGWIGSGAAVERFELEFGALVGAEHCVAVSSGTAALHLALRVLDLRPGSKVVTTPLTWVSTHHAILYERCVPVLADIDATTGNIDPSRVADRLGERPGAILAVHYGGYPCDLDELAALARNAGAAMIEDCAHAVGASYRGRPVGSGANLQCFSFSPTKNLTAAGGGAVATGDAEQAERLRRLRSLGIARNTSQRMREDSTPYRERYGLDELGFRYEMSDLHAAIGLAQIRHLELENARRREIAVAYEAGLADVSGIELLRHSAPGRRSSHHLFAVLAEDRSQLAEALQRQQIEVGVHYPPNELVPVGPDELPSMSHFGSRTLSLPMHSQLRDEDVEAVIQAIRTGW